MRTLYSASIILIIGVIVGRRDHFLANKWRGWLIVASLILCLGLAVAFFGAFWIDMEKGEVHRRQIQEEIRSGRYHFADQPALLAVAQAISANDQNAISRGREGRSGFAGASSGTERRLLCWAVRETWQRPQLVESVKTLLSLGVEPNFTKTAIGTHLRWATQCMGLLRFCGACLEDRRRSECSR